MTWFSIRPSPTFRTLLDAVRDIVWHWATCWQIWRGHLGLIKWVANIDTEKREQLKEDMKSRNHRKALGWMNFQLNSHWALRERNAPGTLGYLRTRGASVFLAFKLLISEIGNIKIYANKWGKLYFSKYMKINGRTDGKYFFYLNHSNSSLITFKLFLFFFNFCIFHVYWMKKWQFLVCIYYLMHHYFTG